MIYSKDLQALITLYEKHGWLLRRVLVTDPEAYAANGNFESIINVPYMRSEIDAAWFSRPPCNGPIAWELRYLGEKPFALLENLNENDADFEQSLAEIESRLQAAVDGK